MWKVIVEGETVTLSRFSGKTFPCISYARKEDKIYGRDDNGKKPSATFSYEGATELSVKCMLCHISQPHPSPQIIQDFITQCSAIQV